MKRTVNATLKLFVWLSLIVAFATYSVTPAFARMPSKASTTSENSGLRDHTTHSKTVDLTKQHPGEPSNNLRPLRIIEVKIDSTGREFNKSSLSAEESKALSSVLSKAIAGASLNNGAGQLQIIELNARGEFNKRALTEKEIKALKNAVKKTAAAANNCAMADDESRWGGCVKNCLADVGVSAYSLIICGATCVTGVVPICAICLGVTVAVLEACGVGCAIYAN